MRLRLSNMTISVAKLIRDTIKVSVQRISEQEQQNAEGIAGIQIQ